MGRKLADGLRSVFAATTQNGSEPAFEFLADLPEDQRQRMDRQIEYLADGKRLSRERFRPLRGGIWELKDYQRRILLFRNQEGYHLTHGFIKKTNRPTRKSEIKKAEAVLRFYEESATNERTKPRKKARPRKPRRKQK